MENPLWRPHREAEGKFVRRGNTFLSTVTLHASASSANNARSGSSSSSVVSPGPGKIHTAPGESKELWVIHEYSKLQLDVLANKILVKNYRPELHEFVCVNALFKIFVKVECKHS